MPFRGQMNQLSPLAGTRTREMAICRIIPDKVIEYFELTMTSDGLHLTIAYLKLQNREPQGH
jgi:hypothetical protein